MLKQNLHSFDDTKLYMVINEASSQKGTVIIVHGLSEHLGRYEHVASKLNDAGYSTYRYDHRGHGRSEGKRTYFRSFTDISDDLNAVVDYVNSNTPDGPVFILGHSMGGYAAACFGTRFPRKVDGIILTGALTRQNNNHEAFPICLPDDEYIDNSFSDNICSDPEVCKDYDDDELVEKRISAGLLNRCWEGVQYLKNNAENFVDSVLVLHGCCDKIVSEKDSRDFFEEISSKDKALNIYAGLYHEILNEPSKDFIISNIINWLNSRL